MLNYPFIKEKIMCKTTELKEIMLQEVLNLQLILDERNKVDEISFMDEESKNKLKATFKDACLKKRSKIVDTVNELLSTMINEEKIELDLSEGLNI
jgi:hypothetical protein